MIPKPTWPKAPERGSAEALNSEYLETKRRAQQALDDMNAGIPDIFTDLPWTWLERALGALMAAVAFVVLVIFCIDAVLGFIALALHVLAWILKH